MVQAHTKTGQINSVFMHENCLLMCCPEYKESQFYSLPFTFHIGCWHVGNLPLEGHMYIYTVDVAHTHYPDKHNKC